MSKKYLFNGIEGTFDIVAGQEEYLQASKGTNQFNFSTNDDVIFDTVDKSAGSGITLDTSTGKFTLKAGKTYRLTGSITFEHTSPAWIAFAWYNITDSVQISQKSIIRNASSNGDWSSNPIMQTIITPTIDTQVSIRCVLDGDGVEDVNAGYSWVIIEKIADSIYNVMTVGSIDEKLKRVDNDLFETAQNGIEYYSPIQHGRIYGIVYRKYFDIANAVGVGQTIDIPLGVTITQFIGFGGFVEQLGGALLPIPFNWVDYTSDNVGVMILSNKQTLRIASGTTLDHEGGKCWIDYSK